MRVFVPMPDEWESGLAFAGMALVPYRAGLPLWREPVAEKPREEGAAGEVPLKAA